jgi:hypothetical protein
MTRSGSFAPTKAERAFQHHFSHENLNQNFAGPAHSWLKQNQLSYDSRVLLEFWDQNNDDRWLTKLLEDPLPPFEVPWSTPEEFLSRVHDLMEVCPEWKDVPYAQPRSLATPAGLVRTTNSPLPHGCRR